MKKACSMIAVWVMLFSLLFIPAETAYAANISLKASSSSVQIGDTFTVTVTVPDNISGTVDLKFSSKILTFTKASAEVNTNGEIVSISMGKYGLAASKTVTVTFKAKTSGDAVIQASGIDVYDHEQLTDASLGSASVNVKVENQTVEEPVKSGDNSLSSLRVSSGTLSPKFQYNVTKYTATVDYSVKSVVVSAKTSNANAVIESVTGNGTISLKVGENTIEVVVRAENGVKSTYQIVVTRKAKPEEKPTEKPTEKPEVKPQVSESENEIVSEVPSEVQSEIPSESESIMTGLEEILQWNNEKLTLPEDITPENIPADFEKSDIFVNGNAVPGLIFKNGDLKVLYLLNTNGIGGYYVFEELQQSIYPLVKLNIANSYIFVLMPDEEVAPVPEGFVKCTLSIEGKGVVTAYQLAEKLPQEELTSSEMTEMTSEEATQEVLQGTESVGTEEMQSQEVISSETVSEQNTTSESIESESSSLQVSARNKTVEKDFYLLYAMNHKGETGWYLYDVEEQTFQRYVKVVHVEKPEETENDETQETESTLEEIEDTQITEESTDYEQLQKELATAKKLQNVLIVACVVLAIVFLITLVLFLKQNRESAKG